MPLPAGARLGPYEVLGLVGAGAMGEVYKAQDTRLGRIVAIKVLPATAAADARRLRAFEREARVVATLSHTNVLAVYDVGIENNAPYLVSELLEGETLRARLRRGAIAPARAVELAVQIARGIAAAHEKGIVHRDLKPDNVFVTRDGTVKILDFGIARLKDPDAAEAAMATTRTSTTLGAIVGTPGYLAPEQVRGLPVDHRADIFAFGCVLYEMLSGLRAFPGQTVADTVSAVLSSDPVPLHLSGVPAASALQGLVQRCLEKEPPERFSSAHDLALALQGLWGPPDAGRRLPVGTWVRRHRLAVTIVATLVLAAATALPMTWRDNPVLSFAPRDWVVVADVENQTGDTLFDKSLRTALVVSLEQSQHANVVPRTRMSATLQRMGKTADTPVTEPIGREICVREKVRGLIAPAIGKVGERYSLTARIVDPATGESVRSYIETADTADDVLPALGSIAEKIRHDLGESLASIQTSNRSLPAVTTSSLEALGMFEDGAALWTRRRYDEAIQMYLSALKIDPDFAMVHAALGTAYYSHIYNNPTQGKVHLERALQLSNRTTDREARIIQIEYEGALGHDDRARSLFELYLRMYPDDVARRYNYAGALRVHGDYEQAIAQYREVLRLNPSDAGAYINLATSYAASEHTQEALDAYAKAFELQPTWITSGNLNHEYGFIWVRAGDVARAEAIFLRGIAADNKPLSTRSLALLDMYRGRCRTAAERLHDAILLNRSQKAPLSESRNELFLAMTLEARGDAAGSRRALDRARDAFVQTKGQVWLAARIGVEYARRHMLAQAEAMLARTRAESEPTSREHSGQAHWVEGEIVFTRGDHARAIDLLLVADKEAHSPLSVASLARAYRLDGQVEKAIAAHEALLALFDGSLGWEAQGAWLDAHYWLATLYQRTGDTKKALGILDDLLARWKDADPDLPMLERAQRLRATLGTAGAGE